MERQLDRQRQHVHPAADLRDCIGIAVAQREVGIVGSRAFANSVMASASATAAGSAPGCGSASGDWEGLVFFAFVPDAHDAGSSAGTPPATWAPSWFWTRCG